MHATIPKGNMRYDQFTVSDTNFRTYLCYFSLALENTENIYPWPLVPFSQISLKNSELKTIHSTFRDCRVHFIAVGNCADRAKGVEEHLRRYRRIWRVLECTEDLSGN